MQIDVATSLIINKIKLIFENEDIKTDVTQNMNLVGSNSYLDSMGLVELCLYLADKADEYNFEFDWTSEKAMSKSQGMFRTVNSLAVEYVSQYKKR